MVRPGGRVPQPGGAVGGGGGEQGAIRRERHPDHPVGVAGQGAQVRSGARVPQLDGAIGGGGGEPGAIVGERHRPHPVLVAGQGAQVGSGGRVPQLDGAIGGGGGEPGAIVGERHPGHLTGVTAQDTQRVAACHIDDLHAWSPGQGEQRAVGGERHIRHAPGRGHHDVGAVPARDRDQSWGRNHIVGSGHTQQSGAIPLPAGDPRTGEIAPFHANINQLGVTQVRSGEVGSQQPRAAQVSPPQVRSGKVGFHQPGTAQHSSAQVRVLQITSREVQATQIDPGQHLVCSGAEPLGDGQSVLLRYLGGLRVGQHRRCPAAGHLVARQVTEEVTHERRHLPGEKGVGQVTVPEALGCGIGHQPLHHGLVDERELPLVGAHQERAHPHRVGCLADGVPEFGEPGQGDRHLGGELRQRDCPLRAHPQPQGQGGAGRQPVGLLQGWPAALILLPGDLSAQPEVDQLPVELRRADLPTLAAHGAQPLLVQVRDERQHARVVRQAEQFLHVAEQRKPGLGLDLITAVVLGQELQDLLLGEVLQHGHSAGDEGGDLISQCGADLGGGPEVLGAAGEHDLGMPGDRTEHELQVVGGVVVADPQLQLVVSVDEQRDPSTADHVPELVDVDGAHLRPDQVLHQQLDRRGCSLQAP